jgi:Zn-dependent protease with chaperone function
MADESSDSVRRARVRARLCLLLAGVSCAVFLVFLVLLNRSVQHDPLGPLRDVRFSVIGVGINFALALGSVAAFSYWRHIERARRARPPLPGPGH